MNSTLNAAQIIDTQPVYGMLHLLGDDPEAKLRNAQREVALMSEHGVDGVVVENYFGDHTDVKNVLEWLDTQHLDLTIGLNVLRDFEAAYALTHQYHVDFVQIDSVAGHLPPQEDEQYEKRLQQLRSDSDAMLFGGVRFKYQPVQSGRSEQEDLLIGKERCDAIVVSGEGTGEVTSVDKVERFRAVVGADFPLLIGSGLRPDNAAAQLAVADGAIVGSYFKDEHIDRRFMNGAHVQQLMEAVEQARKGKE